MNFRPESGYDVAVKIFRAIGVPVSDKNIPPSASQSGIIRPVSHSSVQQLPSYSVYSQDTPLKPEYVDKVCTSIKLIGLQVVSQEQRLSSLRTV